MNVRGAILDQPLPLCSFVNADRQQGTGWWWCPPCSKWSMPWSLQSFSSALPLSRQDGIVHPSRYASVKDGKGREVKYTYSTYHQCALLNYCLRINASASDIFRVVSSLSQKKGFRGVRQCRYFISVIPWLLSPHAILPFSYCCLKNKINQNKLHNQKTQTKPQSSPISELSFSIHHLAWLAPFLCVNSFSSVF